MVRYFKKVKNNVLHGVGRAETEAYAAELIADGYVEVSKEYYQKIMRMDLYIVYRIE